MPSSRARMKRILRYRLREGKEPVFGKMSSAQDTEEILYERIRDVAVNIKQHIRKVKK